MFSPAIFWEFESLRTSSKSTKFSLSATRNHFSKAFILILLVLTLLLSECYGVKIVPPLQWDIQNITPLPHITISHFTFPRIFYNFQFSMFQKSGWHFSQEFHLNLIFSIVISAIYPPLLRFAEEESEAKLNKVIMVSWKSYSQSLPLLLSQTNSSIEAFPTQTGVPHTNI